MADDTVKIQTEYDQEKFEEMKEFIEEFKGSRKTSKKFYSQKMMDLAYLYLEEHGDQHKKLKQALSD